MHDALVCVCPEKVRNAKSLGMGSVVITLNFLYFLLSEFFLLPFWEKNILNKCSGSSLVLKHSKSLLLFRICLFQAFLLISLLELKESISTSSFISFI